MFRGDLIGEFRWLLRGLSTRTMQPPVGEGRFMAISRRSSIASWRSSSASRFFGEGGRVGDEDGGGEGVVLGLGEEVGGAVERGRRSHRLSGTVSVGP